MNTELYRLAIGLLDQAIAEPDADGRTALLRQASLLFKDAVDFDALSASASRLAGNGGQLGKATR